MTTDTAARHDAGDPQAPPADRDSSGRRVAGVSAVHEAAHVATAIGCGLVVDSATLHPPHVRMRPDADTSRDATEAHIVSTLAGSLAESYAAPSSGYSDTSGEWAERAAAELESRSPRARELLRAHSLTDDARELLGDEAAAQALGSQYAGQTARLYVEWLRAVADEMVLALWPVITALALELEARGHLSGDECAAIYHQHAGASPAQQETP